MYTGNRLMKETDKSILGQVAVVHSSGQISPKIFLGKLQIAGTGFTSGQMFFLMPMHCR